MGTRQYKPRGGIYSRGLVLRNNPAEWLAKNGSPPIMYYIHRHILGDRIESRRLFDRMTGCSEIRDIFARQLPSGGWGKDGDLSPRDGSSYGSGCIQVLDYVSDLGFTADNPDISRAVDYVLRFRTHDGRFFWKPREVRAGKGEHGCYWGVMYEGYMVKILSRFGVSGEKIRPSIRRLIKGQQEDGSWVLRYRHDGDPHSIRRDMIDSTGDRITATTAALAGLSEVSGIDRSVLEKGVSYLLQNLFNYTHGMSRNGQELAEWYYAFRYPEFYASVLKSLVIARRLGIRDDDPRMAAGLRWLLTKQGKDGFWRTHIPRSLQQKYKQLKKNDDWVTLLALVACKGFCGTTY